MKKNFFFLSFFLTVISLFSKEIVILHTNDIRNVLERREATFINPEFPPVLGGIYSLSTAVKYERELANKKNQIFLLFDSGNFVYKSVDLDSTDFTKPSLYFNYMGYDVVNIGVDEIIAGPKFLNEAFNLFNPKLISSNLKIVDSQIQPQKYVIIEKEGIRIGIFGLVSEYATLNMDEEVAKYYIIEKEIEKAKEVVDILKKNRCSIIIGLTSVGLEHDRIIAENVQGIDIMLGGFDGIGLRNAIETPLNHTIIMKGYGELSSFDKLTLFVDDFGRIINYESEVVTLFEERYPSDLELEKILK
uniref:Bifunctional metallophosphatase/5'-nucleotidase n=1 Tax=candidate division WOR-3 bacterium TaxID=2052148 RepID=A0A7C3NAM0_UNCW3